MSLVALLDFTPDDVVCEFCSWAQPIPHVSMATQKDIEKARMLVFIFGFQTGGFYSDVVGRNADHEHRVKS
ncbi:hypothetical protein RBWH47_02928 [Rhodopirellula baltica WH47]|uniref:Uncharacterized protein n=1 Tax=Rhodopirellula baltica WH47 TaxID=991778 RepID=F2B131_RHOBT|nr:hypothetical protein RBWH47_02928 [Rhodopirellula baltica WH47]